MNKAFTIWTRSVQQTIANDGVSNYGIHLASVYWRQPKWGGQMTVFHQDSGEIGCSFHSMGRRDA